jgi:hypothetical protein
MRRARSAARSRSRSDATSVPSMRTTPLEGSSSVPMIESIVVLPEPDAPTIATSSPASTRRSTPCSTRSGGVPG